jgi:uncharacterized membrane protein
MKTKKILLLISICVLIAFSVVAIYDMYNLSQEPAQNPPLQENSENQNESAPPPGPQPPPQQRPQDQVLMVPLSGVLLIMAIIALAFYVIYSTLEKNFEKKLKLISNVTYSEINESKNESKKVDFNNVILNLLNVNEKKVVKRLLEQNGNLLQSEISKIENMGRVKTHRTVKDLELKGIINTEKYGNTNRIYLTNSVKKMLQSST